MNMSGKSKRELLALAGKMIRLHIARARGWGIIDASEGKCQPENWSESEAYEEGWAAYMNAPDEAVSTGAAP